MSVYETSDDRSYPAASDMFDGASCQADVDARIGDFIALLDDHGIVVDARGAVRYDASLAPPVCFEHWRFRQVRPEARSLAIFRAGAVSTRGSRL